jgi:hypothetical protein
METRLKNPPPTPHRILIASAPATDAFVCCFIGIVTFGHQIEGAPHIPFFSRINKLYVFAAKRSPTHAVAVA